MSSGELFLTFFVALLVFGPNKLPMLAEHLGKLLRLLNQLKQQATLFWETQLHEYQLRENTRKAEQVDAIYQESEQMGNQEKIT
ncbi:Sec-independent protein translocase subunit TatA/TatB [Legionella micdadei]|uniref:Putative TatB protein (Twin arginine translocation) n=1 Tax=Legionella micdadei TaxID=451 RepID=A0A098GAI7_LEGMI|nr:twin-arginine translocase TatA/TatE family subunit [Legionella micdadei]ARG96261.1 preprotein translocase subunit TatB [Legionella micdadei]ARG99016.1 preprotein translocase subunit TatB [Legionella micdadei]KTD29080.1 TatB protein (twin arginine translocation) [Legionella micdadei]NSL17288.1 twin-arginine translocase TatA/TatE family subunit [Legionella micdadei]CEG59443.1 putative TatB protein (Twin arginine translocation) [Legionella micdadei]